MNDSILETEKIEEAHQKSIEAALEIFLQLLIN